MFILILHFYQYFLITWSFSKFFWVALAAFIPLQPLCHLIEHNVMESQLSSFKVNANPVYWASDTAMAMFDYWHLVSNVYSNALDYGKFVALWL